MNASADGTKGKTMTTFFNDLRTAMRKRAAYNRTVAELQSMPLDVALDLGLYRGDAHAIARQAVYGN
jgi:uncharacterized protein YjiS (DUF1127 family)